MRQLIDSDKTVHCPHSQEQMRCFFSGDRGAGPHNTNWSTGTSVKTLNFIEGKLLDEPKSGAVPRLAHHHAKGEDLPSHAASRKRSSNRLQPEYQQLNEFPHIRMQAPNLRIHRGIHSKLLTERIPSMPFHLSGYRVPISKLTRTGLDYWQENFPRDGMPSS